MGVASKPLQVKLLCAIMFQETYKISEIIETLENKFGKIDYQYGPIPFIWTSYYSSEMGESLQKMYITFQKTIDRAELPQIKIYTNEIEQKQAILGKRAVNIDPGYISRDKLVLASTKDFYHRLYLQDGIYGEVTLHYQEGRYRHFSWTYPDYKDSKAEAFFEKVRANLVKEIRTSLAE